MKLKENSGCVGCVVIVVLGAAALFGYKPVYQMLARSKTMIATVEVASSDGWKLVFDEIPWDGSIQIKRLEGTMTAEIPPENHYEKARLDLRSRSQAAVMKIDQRGLISQYGGVRTLSDFGYDISPGNWLVPDGEAPIFGLVGSITRSGSVPELGRKVWLPSRSSIRPEGIPVAQGDSMFIGYNRVAHGFFSVHWQPVTGRILYSVKFQPSFRSALLASGSTEEYEERKGQRDRTRGNTSQTARGASTSSVRLPGRPPARQHANRLPDSSPPGKIFGLTFVWIPPRSPGEAGFWMSETETTWSAVRKWVEGAEYRAAAGGNDIGVPNSASDASRRREKLLFNSGIQSAEEIRAIDTGQNNHPARIRREAASMFCASLGGRLPNDYEWQWAACGGNPSWAYPWGNSRRSGYRTCNRDCAPSRVARHRPNPFGLYDMEGNAGEWCGTEVRSFPFGVCGGDEHGIRPVYYIDHTPYHMPTGFRCVIDP